MPNSILGTHDCYGCGACAVACGKKIIKMALNKSGFLEPQIIYIEKCTDCGLCSSVCSIKYNAIAQKRDVRGTYAAWSNDKLVQLSSSSGGTSFELGRYCISQGYKVCGVRYNVEKGQAEHYISETIEELAESVGSKYIQSFTEDCFQVFNRKEKYLVFGSPCQIDSLRRYIQKFHMEEKFILVDFFCHGIPSKHLWNKYLEEKQRKYGKIEYASWRNKIKGFYKFKPADNADVLTNRERIKWHDGYNLFVKGERGEENSGFINKNSFLRMFLGDYCLNKACFDDCKYKQTSSSADIRIGDFWGSLYQNNHDGVSSVIAFTEKGEMLLNSANITIVPCELKNILEVQMKSNPERPIFYNQVMKSLQDENVSLQQIINKYYETVRFMRLPIRILNKLTSIKKRK